MVSYTAPTVALGIVYPPTTEEKILACLQRIEDAVNALHMMAETVAMRDPKAAPVPRKTVLTPRR